MGFRNGAYATVWKVYERNGAVSVQLSTSYKKKDSNPPEYIVDWQGFALCKFGALEFVRNLPNPIPKNGIRVKIGNCDVTTKYDAQKKITYTNYEILDMEDGSSNNKGGNSNAGSGGNTVYRKPASNNNPHRSAPASYDDDEAQLPF